MPFTPFHWGISILIQSLLLFLDPVALFIGSIIPDIEGITAWFILPGMGLPLHGPLHSFTGTVFLGLITGISSLLCFKYLFPLIIEQLQLNLLFSVPEYSLRCSLFSAFIGNFSHIILDAALYNEMDLLYPLGIGNPWYGILSSSMIYSICVISFFLGISILTFRFYRKSIKLKGI
ncbi:MAG: hypothetical protein ACXADY_17470 [Candidatus Hodarchaeales archaeon]